jgi:hypothetical protein
VEWRSKTSNQSGMRRSSQTAVAIQAGPRSSEMNSLQNESHINVYAAAERRYWCEQLGCTEGMLLALVVNIGTNADDVRRAAASGPTTSGDDSGVSW